MATRRLRRVRRRGSLLLCLVFLAVASVGCRQQSRTASLITQWARVDSIVDGDTLILAHRRHVRLIGINSPKRGKDGAPDEALAQAAHERLRQLVDDHSGRARRAQ